MRARRGAVDTVITNALIVDHWGIVKADVRLKAVASTGIGKAGNPDTQPGVDIVIGPGTEMIAGEGKILTAGAIDCAHPLHLSAADRRSAHVWRHHDDGRRHRPGHWHLRDDLHPGPWHIQRMFEALDAWPMNIGLAGKGNTSLPAASSK